MGISLEAFVWVVFASIVVAIAYSYVCEGALRRLVKILTENNVNSEENAKTLKELGYKSGLLLKITAYAAKSGSAISRAIVKIPLQSENENKNNEDLLFSKKSEFSCYIPEENRTKSFEKHIKEALSLKKLLILLVVLTLIALSAVTVIKFLSNYAENLVSGDGNTPVGVEAEDDSLLNQQEKLNEDEEKQKLLEEAEKNKENLEEYSDENSETESFDGENTVSSNVDSMEKIQEGTDSQEGTPLPDNSEN